MSKLPFTRALIVKPSWLYMILDGHKQIEIRGTHTKIRGTIGLIRSGTGLIYGQADIVNSVKLKRGHAPTDMQMLNYAGISTDTAFDWYINPHQWHLSNAKAYDKPIPYNHPRGAVIWVDVTKEGVCGG